MLERLWRKGSPPRRLVGKETEAATTENSMEVPSNPELAYDSTMRSWTYIQTITYTKTIQALSVHSSTRPSGQDVETRSECLLMDECTKVSCVNTVEYYSVIDKSEIETAATASTSRPSH